MTIKKPQLAEDIELDKVAFPCWVEPKIDGVRSMNITGRLVGRSLDEFEGFGISDYFSKPEFRYFDGEMILGNNPMSVERLCSATTGAMGRFKGVSEMADLHWWVFDWLEFPKDMYKDRYQRLMYAVKQLNHPRIHLVPYAVVNDLAKLQHYIALNGAMGYEGTITRNPNAPLKEGRSTKKGQELWRFKPWSDAEILVTGITEGNRNENEAKRNTLGRTERSSSMAGLVPNGQVGSIQGTLLKDFLDPITGATLFKKGLEVTLSSGEMSVAEATHYFNNPSEIVGHVAKFKHMTHGVKDQPRFPIFSSLRLKTDLDSSA